MHFTCNEKETIIKDVVPHKDFACNEKKTIINDVVPHKDITCNEKEAIIKMLYSTRTLPAIKRKQ